MSFLISHQSEEKPKDGKYPNQNVGTIYPNPDPLYTNDEYGDYRNEAHHCISGNEIMKGHPIEKVMVEGDKFLGNTGYTINNGANGVFLPSYPKKYKGWGDEFDPKKYEVMKLAMDAGHGQAHIGGHTGHNDNGGKDYPTAIKEELTALHKRVIEKSEECPFCVDNAGKEKKPFVPPYKLNQWLDTLSRDIISELTGPVESWPYFISKYAMQYYKDNKSKKKSKGKRFSK